MRVTALFFAVHRDLFGIDELEIALPDGTTVAGLLALLRERTPGGALPASPVVAVNREYATGDTVLSDGDEVALIPPVAGG